MVLIVVRIVYHYCAGGKDLSVWYEMKSQGNGKEPSGSDELCALINEFLNKHLVETVTKVRESTAIRPMQFQSLPFICHHRAYPSQMRTVCSIIRENGTTIGGRATSWMPSVDTWTNRSTSVTLMLKPLNKWHCTFGVSICSTPWTKRCRMRLLKCWNEVETGSW